LTGAQLRGLTELCLDIVALRLERHGRTGVRAHRRRGHGNAGPFRAARLRVIAVRKRYTESTRKANEWE
jgi:hypothetical protein